MLTILIVVALAGGIMVFVGKSWLGYGLISLSLIIRAITMPERDLEAAAIFALSILFVGIPIKEWVAARRKPETLNK